MPSAIAHALVGSSLATAMPDSRRPWLFAATLALLSAAPDLDVIAFRFGIPYDHPLGHRGLTHSLFFATVLTLVGLPLWRRLAPERPRLATALVFVALASHGLLDTFTNAGLGIGLLLPFEGGRYFAPWRPIETSPLSIAEFLSPRGLVVLASEALWVGLPCVIGVSGIRIARRIRRSRAGGRLPGG